MFSTNLDKENQSLSLLKKKKHYLSKKSSVQISMDSLGKISAIFVNIVNPWERNECPTFTSGREITSQRDTDKIVSYCLVQFLTVE